MHLDHARTVLGLSVDWPLALDSIAPLSRIQRRSVGCAEPKCKCVDTSVDWASYPGLLSFWSRGVYLGSAMIVGISSREVRPVAIHRAAVDFDTPHTSAAARTEPPGTAIGFGTLRGRPSRVPCVRARAKPAWTRSRIRSRSNSASAARTCSCSVPAGVVASRSGAWTAHSTVPSWPVPHAFGTNAGTMYRQIGRFVSQWPQDDLASSLH